MALIFSPELLPKVLDGSKTVTRRRSPRKVGSLQAVQPKRGVKGVGFVRVVSCVPALDWEIEFKTVEDLKKEAKLEGFENWVGFEKKIFELYKTHWVFMRNDCFRIEFVLVK